MTRNCVLSIFFLFLEKSEEPRQAEQQGLIGSGLNTFISFASFPLVRVFDQNHVCLLFGVQNVGCDELSNPYLQDLISLRSSWNSFHWLSDGYFLLSSSTESLLL